MSESKQRLERENRELRGEVCRLRGVIVGLARGDAKSVEEAQLIVRVDRVMRAPQRAPQPAHQPSAKTAAILAMAAAVIPN